MSITSKLKNPDSAASRWLDANFDLDAATKCLGAQVGGADTIRPGGDLKNYPWANVGHAVELRLDQACGVHYYKTAGPYGQMERFTNAGFHDALAMLWGAHIEEERTSRRNAWVLYFAGVCEGVFFGGRGDALEIKYKNVLSVIEDSSDWKRFRSAMAGVRAAGAEDEFEFDVDDHLCLNRLVEMMPVADAVLDDIVTVCDAMFGSANFRGIRGNPTFVDWPVFDGGAWLGGADGDFMVGNTLYDVKTTIRPENLWRGATRQLVAYVALDDGDDYQIEELAVFLPRQHGEVARVSLDEILAHSTFDNRRDMQLSAKNCLSGTRSTGD